MPSLGEAPNGGAKALGYLAPGGVPFFQVTRRKGGTVGSRNRRNGYAPNPDPNPNPNPINPPQPATHKPRQFPYPLEFHKNPAVLSQGSGDEPVVNLQDA